MDAATAVPTPANERVLAHRPGSPERAVLEGRLRSWPPSGWN